MTYANNYTSEATRMEFNQKELEYLLNCLNLAYLDADLDSCSKEHKQYIMELNATLCKKIDEQLVLHRRAF